MLLSFKCKYVKMKTNILKSLPHYFNLSVLGIVTNMPKTEFLISSPLNYASLPLFP